MGWETVRLAKERSLEIAAFTREELDITQAGEVCRAMADVKPGLVINAAAYTQVDRAESEPDRAFAVNAVGPGILAGCCVSAGIPMIHISTDYVFDGTGRTPYRESDPLSPLGVYGRSKAQGEAAIREQLSRHLIVRTSWVYGVHGANFVKTMLKLGKERPSLRVVADQVGSPTSAGDLAQLLLTLAARIQAGTESWGTYHFCGAGVTSWHGFAEAIFRLAREYGYSFSPVIEAIPTAEYPTPAARPAYSALDTARIRDSFGIDIPPWEESLRDMLKEMLEA